MSDKDIIKSLMHLIIMNNIVEQINKNKIKITMDIYNRFLIKKQIIRRISRSNF